MKVCQNTIPMGGTLLMAANLVAEGPRLQIQPRTTNNTIGSRRCGAPVLLFVGAFFMRASVCPGLALSQIDHRDTQAHDNNRRPEPNGRGFAEEQNAPTDSNSVTR